MMNRNTETEFGGNRKMALITCRKRGECSRLLSQQLCPLPWGIWEDQIDGAHRLRYVIRNKVARILHSSSCIVSKPSELASQSLGPFPCGFDPWVGKIPWRRAWQHTPVCFPGKAPRQRSLVGYNPCGIKETDMTEHNWAYTSLVYCPVTFLKCKKPQGWSATREGKHQVWGTVRIVSGSDRLALWSVNRGVTETLTFSLSYIHYIYPTHIYLVSL